MPPGSGSRNAVELAFGGVPDDVVFESDVQRGDPGHVLVSVACRPG